MKLLFLCKRRPMGRDLLTTPYGRFYYLPRLLALRGHEVSIFLCSYKMEPDQYDVHDEDGIRWYSVSLASLNPFRYYYEVRQLARKIGPDWIVSFSDTYYGVLAYHLAHRFGCKSLIDAYDNYESYMQWFRPLHYLWQRALIRADMITAAGPQLAEIMGRHRKEKPPKIVPMAADPCGFKPLDKLVCRENLGLPKDRKLIGYCGSIHPSRGIDVLFDAYKILAQEHPDVELVLAGRKAPGINIPEGVRWLGYLPDEKIPLLLNCMDVLTVINKDSSFGNFSYPVKLYEAMCCRIPVVATATPATEWILAEHSELLAPPGDSVELSRIISRILQETTEIDYGKEEGWEKESVLFERAMTDRFHPA